MSSISVGDAGLFSAFGNLCFLNIGAKKPIKNISCILSFPLYKVLLAVMALYKYFIIMLLILSFNWQFNYLNSIILFLISEALSWGQQELSLRNSQLHWLDSVLLCAFDSWLPKVKRSHTTFANYSSPPPPLLIHICFIANLCLYVNTFTVSTNP